MNKTINQINAFVKRNQVIEMYLNLSTDKARYTSDDYRLKYFNFKRNEHTIRLSIIGNFLYAAMAEALSDYCKGYKCAPISNRFGKYTYSCDRYGNRYSIMLILECNCHGVTIEMRNSSYAKQFPPFERYQVKSNLPFEDFDFEKYFAEKIAPKYLYADGLFKNIQTVYGLQKNEVAAKYKQLLALWKKRDVTVDTEKAYRQMFKLKRNILIEGNFSDSVLNKIFATYTYQKKRMKLFKRPNLFSLHDEYSSLHDTDEHLEEFINDVYNEYPKNSIII